MEAYADYQHTIVQKIARDLTANQSDSREKLESIFLFVRDSIKFGFAPEGDLVKASETIERGYGQCNNKGVLLLALCRAAGIKARLHFSTISKEIQKGIFSGIAYWLLPREISHCWVEVEIDGDWYQIDSYINDLTFHKAAIRELNKRGWSTGFSVSGVNVEPSAELVLDEAHHTQMGAVTGDHGTWDQAADYFAGSAYLNRLGPLGRWLYKLYIPIANRRVERMRSNEEALAGLA